MRRATTESARPGDHGDRAEHRDAETAAEGEADLLDRPDLTGVVVGRHVEERGRGERRRDPESPSDQHERDRDEIDPGRQPDEPRALHDESEHRERG